MQEVEDSSCLSKLIDWLGELLKRGFPMSTSIGKISIDNIYPKAIQTEDLLEQVVTELRILLPDAPEANAILPVLVTGYIMNRRGASEESDLAVHKNATGLYRNLFYNGDISAYMKSTKDRFRVCSWKKMYLRITYCQLTKSRMTKSLSYFGMLNLFLFLAYKMKEFCNLTLSCDLFEEFTGYPGLCDKFFPRLEIETPLHTQDDPLKKDISAYLNNLYGSDLPDDIISTIDPENQLGDEAVFLETMEGVYAELYGELCETCTQKKIKNMMEPEDPELDCSMGTSLDMALDRYIMFFIDAVIQRDMERGKMFAEKDLRENKWAEDIWNDKILMRFR